MGDKMLFNYLPKRLYDLARYKIIFIFCIFSIMNCDKKKDFNSLLWEKNMSSKDIKAIDNLSTKYIFFGHKSVGNNILNGINKLKEKKECFSDIVLYELFENNDLNGPGIYHKNNGENGFPKTKCDAFKNFLSEKRYGDQFDIAFFKFCYVDFQKNTDVQNVFDYYTITIEEIRREFPKLMIIHVTVPLCSHIMGIKGLIKRILVPDIANVKRNQFNQLLKDKYGDEEPIYDLAKIESTLPDGSQSSFKYEGKSYYSLYKGYTDDGGHLNEFGRLIAAKELLIVLAEVAETL